MSHLVSRMLAFLLRTCVQRQPQSTILVCAFLPKFARREETFHRISARLRSYIGFLPVRRTLPNPTHFALAALQHAGVVGPLITQNVDGLHHAALRHAPSETEIDTRILELHGSIFVSTPLATAPLSPAFLIERLLRSESALSTRALLPSCGVSGMAWTSKPTLVRVPCGA